MGPEEYPQNKQQIRLNQLQADLVGVNFDLLLNLEVIAADSYIGIGDHERAKTILGHVLTRNSRFTNYARGFAALRLSAIMRRQNLSPLENQDYLQLVNIMRECIEMDSVQICSYYMDEIESMMVSHPTLFNASKKSYDAGSTLQKSLQRFVMHDGSAPNMFNQLDRLTEQVETWLRSDTNNVESEAYAPPLRRVNIEDIESKSLTRDFGHPQDLQRPDQSAIADTIVIRCQELEIAATVQQILQADFGIKLLRDLARFGDVLSVSKLLDLSVSADSVDDTGQSPLHIATRCGNLEVMQVLVVRGTSLNVADQWGFTPLHWAIIYRRADCLLLLINAGAKFESDTQIRRDLGCMLPIHSAALRGWLEGVHILIRAGADANRRDSQGKTALHHAVEAGNGDCARLLAAFGNLDLKDDLGQTPLLIAVYVKARYIVVTLLKCSANVNDADIGGRTPLMIAAQGGDKNITQLLLTHGADANAKNDVEYTPLMYAARAGHTEVVHLLLENKADAKARGNDGFTPLMFAVRQADQTMIRLLLKHHVDINDKKDDGCTALILAVQQRHGEMIQLLVDHGADVNAQDEFGSTLLMIAVRFRDIEMVQMLLGCRANPNATEKNGSTILLLLMQMGTEETVELLPEHRAYVKDQDESGGAEPTLTVETRDREIASILIQHGADINARDKTGRTSLMVAIRFRDYDMVRMLFLYDADVNAQDISGSTPLTLAVRSRDVDMVRLVVLHGADINAEDKFGGTSLTLAEQIEAKDIVQFLLDHGAKASVWMRLKHAIRRDGRTKINLDNLED